MKLLALVFLVLFVQFLVSSSSVLDNAINSSEEDGFSPVDVEEAKYEPNWESLDSRPLPSWYDQSKIGIFIHWGVFSVPSFGSEWFWHYLHEKLPAYVHFMQENYPPNFTYQDFAAQFTAEFYNATEWVELFAKAGARYVVLTSKHHEGFTNWPSKYSFSWNAMAVGPKRDLVGELAAAVRSSSSGIHFGLYHSLFEWYNPLYLQDQANEYRTDVFARTKALPELYEIVNAYKPELIWSDGDVSAEIQPEYWKSQEFLAWLYNESPVKDKVVVNDRWGANTSCKHGGFFNCMDRYHPYKLQEHKWENAFTLDKNSWGYRRNARIQDYLTSKDVISTLVTTVACGGNVLINVGPTKEGVIAPIMQERLLQLGAWLGVNGDAIYETTPWTTAQNDTTSGFVWFTTKPKQGKLYGIVLQDWGTASEHQLQLGSVIVNSPKEIESVQLLADPGKDLHWKPVMTKTAAASAAGSEGIVIQLPDPAAGAAVISERTGTSWAWTIVITFNKRSGRLLM